MAKLYFHAKNGVKTDPTIFCPACGHAHQFTTGIWDWDGNEEKPTFTPSMLVHEHWYLPDDWEPEQSKDADGNWLYEPDGIHLLGAVYGGRCHSFVRDGKIQFLNDCQHALAGQTVDLPDWEP